ncbi:MAG: hypothetical protein HC836_24005 [Richelia sp. RM2_1_2]|nr:hypothetical protein [Richelia sp. SM2_1_7]NJM23094.1 hypothetical protein [Richelia sp. SM1_7_0]NJN10638.1 hypothetical protein [Richelia sp. RM1_1_1]NJO27875.1 hypothetical protein [Richelia sp. SL_2_1]NJO61202.1 hypothetical protein [Richelia sp. RM2_1_2]
MKNKILAISILVPIALVGVWIASSLIQQLQETKGSSSEGKICKTLPVNEAWLGYKPNRFVIAEDELKFYCSGKVLFKEGFYFLKIENLIFKVSEKLDDITYIDASKIVNKDPEVLQPTVKQREKVAKLLKKYNI